MTKLRDTSTALATCCTTYYASARPPISVYDISKHYDVKLLAPRSPTPVLHNNRWRNTPNRHKIIYGLTHTIHDNLYTRIGIYVMFTTRSMRQRLQLRVVWLAPLPLCGLCLDRVKKTLCQLVWNKSCLMSTMFSAGIWTTQPHGTYVVILWQVRL